MNINKHNLIDSYRSQLELKSDILKSKNILLVDMKTQHKKKLSDLEKRYTDENRILKENHKNQLKKIKESNDKIIEEMRIYYNDLIYISERKNKKLINSNKTWLQWLSPNI